MLAKLEFKLFMNRRTEFSYDSVEKMNCSFQMGQNKVNVITVITTACNLLGRRGEGLGAGWGGVSQTCHTHSNPKVTAPPVETLGRHRGVYGHRRVGTSSTNLVPFSISGNLSELFQLKPATATLSGGTQGDRRWSTEAEFKIDHHEKSVPH